MTRIVFDEEELELRVEGHAGSGAMGEDLICAGCSVLWLTLREALCGTQDRAGRFKPRLFRGNGARRVVCCPGPEEETECRIILQTIAEGYRGLAESFPEYVSFEGKKF